MGGKIVSDKIISIGKMVAGSEDDIYFERVGQCVRITQLSVDGKTKDVITVPIREYSLFCDWIKEAAGDGQHPRKVA
jgi:hypothetical protein